MKILTRPKCMKKVRFHYCPGCHHGLVHKIIGEAIDYFNIREKVVGIAPVGCSVLLYDYFDFDVIEVAHGRAPAVATGIKRANPNLIVFCYQGDGDLASIGIAEAIHAAARGENITVIMINNANYGMTGGQMSPTTLINQKTATTPFGRKTEYEGFPLKVTELLSTIDGVCLSVRVAVNNPKNFKKAKKAIFKAFENQLNSKGFSFVEVLSACPVNWRMTPIEACKWIDKVMIKTFPLGILKGDI